MLTVPCTVYGEYIMNKKYDAVIFDFDGTVVDTGLGIIESLKYSLEKNGVAIPDMEKLRRFIGPPIYDSYINDYGATDDNVADFISSYRERYFVKGIYECELYEGIEHLLRTLKNAGYKTGIASSKPEKLVYDVMAYTKITDYFDYVSAASLDESKHITKAELIKNCANALGLSDMKRVLMVGDRCFDLDGASIAGTDSAGMAYGYGGREELIQHNATYIFDSADELEAFLIK